MLILIIVINGNKNFKSHNKEKYLHFTYTKMIFYYFMHLFVFYDLFVKTMKLIMNKENNYIKQL
jgi:hypothetical protein